MMKIGRITISDRASAGVYEDRSGPEIERVLQTVFGCDITCISCIIPDEQDLISSRIAEYSDAAHCDLIITTGGTGITPRDVTPEATKRVIEKELPGFGEIMRVRSFEFVRTAILSRATAGIRGRSLIINLPGKPKAVNECLVLLVDAIKEAIAHLKGQDPHQQP